MKYERYSVDAAPLQCRDDLFLVVKQWGIFLWVNFILLNGAGCGLFLQLRLFCLKINKFE